MLMTCNDIGLPLFVQTGEEIQTHSFLVPAHLVLYTLAMGKTSVGWRANGTKLQPRWHLLKAFAFGSFLKIFGKLGGKLLKALNNKLLKKFPATKKLSAKLCKMGFDPVDLITGRVNYTYTDIDLPGPVPFKFTRTLGQRCCG